MRKLKLQVQTTIDGYISGKNGEMDWMKFPWTEDLIDYVRQITQPVDTILLGNLPYVVYQVFRPRKFHPVHFAVFTRNITVYGCLYL